MAAAGEPKIFKKVEVVEGGGHHGGGWKVAYADFMTAMMAFFLLMWILASSDEQKLKGIAEYFTNATLPGGSGVLDGATLGPPGTLTASNGAVVARGSELGKIDDPSPNRWEVRDMTQTSDPAELTPGSNKGIHENPAAGAPSDETRETPAEPVTSAASSAAGAAEVELEHPIDDMKFEELQRDILQSMQETPDLAPLAENIIFEQTPEGLHIQIVDQEGKPMFYSGKADMAGTTNELLGNLGRSLAELPNHIVIAGHTDAVPFADSANYDNWDLSSDRANATRRVFEAAGVSNDRIIRVSGMADTDPLVPEDPFDPSNRRISIMVQYRTPEMTEAAPAEPEAAQVAEEDATPETPPAASPSAPLPAPTAEPLSEAVLENLRNALR